VLSNPTVGGLREKSQQNVGGVLAEEEAVMNVRIALLFSGILIAASTGAAQATLQPQDPDQAPIASVDRFSDKAATFLVRSADNHLPGPNEPIDFDIPSLSTLGLSPTGKSERYYNLDARSTTPAPVNILYREGEDKPVQGQLDIIDTLPGENGYNDFRQVWKVWVPKDYVANTITDAAMLQQAAYKMEKTDKLLNMPVVPDKSNARLRANGGNLELQRAWYRSQVAKFFLFDEAPLSALGDKVPVSPIYDGLNVNPGEPNGGVVSGFRTEPNSGQTHNVTATAPGDPGYSPLWLRVVYDSADWPSVVNLESALKAKKVPAEVLTINCPVVSIDH
jgi:hypothetical protein